MKGAENLGKIPVGVNLHELYAAGHILTAPSGRPLEEGKKLPPYLKGLLLANGVLFERPTSSYPGSRHGRTMNAPALVEISRGKDELFDGFAWVHDRYFRGKKPTTVTVGQTRELANIAAALPIYLLMRAHDPVEPPLPDIVGHMYKSAEGIERATLDMMKTMLPETVVDAEQIFTHAENNDVLLSPQGGCAASERFIVQTVHALQKKVGDHTQSVLSQLVPDEEFATLQLFSQERDRFLRATNTYHARKTEFMRDVIETGAIDGDTFLDTLLDYEENQEQTLDSLCAAHVASLIYLGRVIEPEDIVSRGEWDESLTNPALLEELNEHPEQQALLREYGIIT